MPDKKLNMKLSLILAIVVLIAGISVGNAISGQAVRKISGPGGGTTTTISSGGTIQLVKGYFVMDINDYALPCTNQVKLENVGTGAVLIDVNGVKATVDLYQTEVVNNCRISVLKLDYQPEIAKSSAVLAMESSSGGTIPANTTVQKSEKGIYSMKPGDIAVGCSNSAAVILENVGLAENKAVLVNVGGQIATIDLGQSEVVNGCLITNVDTTADFSYAKSSAILAI